MKWDILNKKGEKVDSVELVDDVFTVDMNESVLHSVVKAYRANRRQGTHATKTRSLVSGGGKKPFKQKGTGNARQGSSRSPLMPGGATAHGPQPRDYTLSTNKKLKKLAMKIALSEKVRDKKLVIVDDLAQDSYKTKSVIGITNALGLSGHKVLFADDVTNDFFYRSARNIHKVSFERPTEINTENLLHHDVLVLSKSALSKISARLAGGQHESA